MAPAPCSEETVCSDSTSWAGAQFMDTGLSKEVAQGCTSNKHLQRKDDRKPGPHQSLLSEVDFVWHLVKGFVGAWMNWVHQYLPVLILPEAI